MLAKGRMCRQAVCPWPVRPSAFFPVASLLVAKQAEVLATVSCSQSPNSHPYPDPTSLTGTCISLPEGYPHPPTTPCC